jgi:hypothetical protein
MKTVATQFGISTTADFEEMTWTFEMPENFKVWPGEFAIVDKPVYDELLQSCISLLEELGVKPDSDPEGFSGIVENALNVIKKATE